MTTIVEITAARRGPVNVTNNFTTTTDRAGGLGNRPSRFP